MKAFIKSQFQYCPLVRIFIGRQENIKKNPLHEKALRIVYNNQDSNLENLHELHKFYSSEKYSIIIN